MEKKITLAEIYRDFWKCRNFELEHYWQRAIFLTTFLAGCYAGYGSFVISCITHSNEAKWGFVVANGIALGISLIGLILSLLWIMMAKGSKTWYERYESAITAFVDKYGNDSNVFEDGAGKIAGFTAVHMDTFDEEPISDWLWKPCGGTYSVSKINIALGHISVVVWLLLLIVHSIILKNNVASLEQFKQAIKFYPSATGCIVIVICVLLLFWVYTRLVLKSGNLKENC